MARNNRGKNNNPEGRNQYSGWMDSARDRPYTTAAVAAATVGAGVFLWSRRNQISDQLSSLSDQISDWSNNMRSGSSDDELELAEGGGGASINRGTQGRSSTSRRSGATSGSTGSTAQSGSSGTNRQEPIG